LALKAEPTELLGFLGKISSILGLKLEISGTAELERSTTLKAEYGEDGVQLEFSKIGLTVFDSEARVDEDQGSDETLFVTEKILCKGQGEGATPVVVEEVNVKVGDRLITSKSFQTFYPAITLPAQSAQISDTSKPYKIYIKNGGIPYMTSISGPQSYSRIFHLWSEDLDYSTAAVLMSMFNRSCPNRMYKGSNILKDCAQLMSDDVD
jgi:hypothetical protein